MGDLLEHVRGDLLTQQSLSAVLATLALIVVLSVWYAWSTRALKALWAIPMRVLVTGTRGKSSTVRLIHAALTAGGIPTIGKMTGTSSRELDTLGKEYHTNRVGQVSVLEVLETVHRNMKRKGPQPKAVVLECMAVSPDLIEFLSGRIVKPDVVVITNALWDHLEEEGTSLEGIAISLSLALPGAKLMVTSEHRETTRAVLAYEASLRDVAADIVDGRALPDDVITAAPGAHPDNIAMATAVAEYAGVDAHTALEGMAGATSEPLPTVAATAQLQGITWTYRDIGSVNDTDSLTPALEGAKAQMPAGAFVFGMLVTRWDRPLRAMQFAASVTPEDVDGIIIVGEPDLLVRFVARRSGWSNDRIVRISTFGIGQHPLYDRLARTATRISGQRPTDIGIIAMENNHQYVADLVREKFFGSDVI